MVLEGVGPDLAEDGVEIRVEGSVLTWPTLERLWGLTFSSYRRGTTTEYTAERQSFTKKIRPGPVSAKPRPVATVL